MTERAPSARGCEYDSFVIATALLLHLTSNALVATALDTDGNTVAEASSPLETHAPEPGWIEQRPEEWWDAARAAIDALRARTSLEAITTIAITSDIAASVFLDGEREVIRPAILEGDVRNPHPILWLRAHQPVAYKRVQHLLQPADYLHLKLTGEVATTVVDAKSTGVFDAAAGAWDARLCDELEINVELLPIVRVAMVLLLGDVALLMQLPQGVHRV